ncbi:hypothetical protein CYG49_01165 [Candidatus Saccharibacteria bacterium]|nr:MAG: hypothetical protein CYG49_01165 [Candidatus Saccharibacteria bacterium]
MAKKPAKKPTAAGTTSTKVKTTRITAAPAGYKRYFQGRDYSTLPYGAIIAELLGTFTLAIVFLNLQGQPISVLFAYIALVLIFAPLSGSHFNPALTVGLWVARRMSGLRTIGYVLAQVTGAMLALIVASNFIPEAVNQLTGAPEQGKLYAAQELPERTPDLWRVLTIEAIGMFIYAFGFARAKMSPISNMAKGYTIAGAFLLGQVIIQGSQILNPSLALALQAIKVEPWPLAIYVLTPLVSSIAAMALYRFLQKEQAAKANNATTV